MYKLPYDPINAFAPVALLGTGPVVLAVTTKLPVNSLKDLLALARERPGQLNYASAGVGSFQHLASSLFKLQSGLDIVHIPFKGGGPAMMDVIERLHKELSVILASAETKKRFETEGGEAAQMSPEEFGRFIASETVKWAKVVKEAGIKPE